MKEFIEDTSLLWIKFADDATSETNTKSAGFIKIHSRDPFKEKDGSLYRNTFYCHAPVPGTRDIFRVFGVCHKGTFHITHLDPDGKIYWEPHK